MTQQSKKRRKRYEPGSAYAGDVKPSGIFGLFSNVRLFFIIGAIIMIGGLAIGGICQVNANNNSTTTGDNFVQPPSTAEGTGTPGAEATVEVKLYTAAPAMTLDPNKTYTATIKTGDGDIQVALSGADVPQTVNNFVFLAKDGFYNGLTFYHVTSGFDAQAGDPNCRAEQGDVGCTGRGGPGYDLPQEKPGTFSAGTLGMVNGSSFFIALDESPQFDAFTPFGTITSGLDVAQELTQGTEITSIEISEQ